MKIQKKIIISSADTKYFELLTELQSSLEHNNILDDYDFGVLDTGLKKSEVNYLKQKNAIIHKAEWNVQVQKYKVRKRDHLKTQFARAFLPDYFNGYNIYIWLDADTWINDRDTFLLYELGAKNSKLCITPQVDRSYGKFAKVDWFFGFPKKIRTINYKNISKSVSSSLARKYALHATLNAGAFSLNDNPNLWKVFQKNILLASQKGRIFGTDQVALALSIYEDNLPAEFLPAYCNWMCEFKMPFYDNYNKKFVEPFLPHHPIGLMHLAGLDEIRSNSNLKLNIRNLQGNLNKHSIRFKKSYD